MRRKYESASPATSQRFGENMAALRYLRKLIGGIAASAAHLRKRSDKRRLAVAK